MIAVIALLSVISFHTSDVQPEDRVGALADRYCIQPDGDHRLTWNLAERDGFLPLVPEDIARGFTARAVEDDTIRGFSRTIQGTEQRVLTAASWLTLPDQGKTYFRWCWVSTTTVDSDTIDSDFFDLLEQRGFRVGKVRLFAWIPRPGGNLEPVSRRVYFRQGNVLAREQGMRQLTVRRFREGAFIGYASPRDEATYRDADWSGADPIPAPTR